MATLTLRTIFEAETVLGLLEEPEFAHNVALQSRVPCFFGNWPRHRPDLKPRASARPSVPIARSARHQSRSVA